MNILIITIIMISGISNMIADILLVSGKDHKNKSQTKEERVMKTPVKHIVVSGLLGLISISFWMVPIYYLSKLDTPLGVIAMISFAIYILTLATFHIVCSFMMLCYKWNKDSMSIISKLTMSYGIVCIVYSSIYTISMIYLSIDGVLKMNIFQYISLPLFSMIIIQGILNKILKRIPHFSSVAGTLGMMISFLGTISIMISNGIG